MRDDAFLNDCLVDGEAGSKRNRRSMRQRALAAALLFEAAIISGLALWPLVTPGTKPPEFVLLAHNQYRGEAIPLRQTRPSTPNSRSQGVAISPNFSQRRISMQILHPAEISAQNTVIPAIETSSPLMPSGPPGLPGGSGNDAWSVAPPKPGRPAVRVIRRSESVQEGQLISRMIPTYPQIARVARISGTVELLVLVGRDGRVLSVEVLSGSPLLAAAAKQAVEQWRYRPAILDGQAVEVEARVTVSFVLDE